MKDGRLVLMLLGKKQIPVLAAWMRTTEKEHGAEEGWRVAMLTRDGDYGHHGNYGPFKPTAWSPIPDLLPPPADDRHE